MAVNHASMLEQMLHVQSVFDETISSINNIAPRSKRKSDEGFSKKKRQALGNLSVNILQDGGLDVCNTRVPVPNPSSASQRRVVTRSYVSQTQSDTNIIDAGMNVSDSLAAVRNVDIVQANLVDAKEAVLIEPKLSAIAKSFVKEITETVETVYQDSNAHLLILPTQLLSKCTPAETIDPIVARMEKSEAIADYTADIMQYFLFLEDKFKASAGYMNYQKDITYTMRAVLVDWLVEVADEYSLNLQTLYTTIGYIDRFLSEVSVQRAKLQLVGVTCMLLAAKFEEVTPPTVANFSLITDSTYSPEQILRMEHLVLKVLKFDLGSATMLSFLNPLLRTCQANDKVRCLAYYLGELTLMDGETYLKFKPSITAISILSLALHSLHQPHWSPVMARACVYEPVEFKECIKCLYDTWSNAPKNNLKAISEKYDRDVYLRVSRSAPILGVPVY